MIIMITMGMKNTKDINIINITEIASIDQFIHTSSIF